MTAIAKPSTYVRFEDSNATQLTYVLRTNPAPLTVSRSSTDVKYGSLEFVISNRTSQTIKVSSITVIIELGNTGEKLAQTTTDIKAQLSDTINWSVNLPPPNITTGRADFALIPKVSGPVSFAAGASVVVQIYDIRTVLSPGTTTVSVKEVIDSGTPVFTPFEVTTFPDSFYFNGLTANVYDNNTPVPVAQIKNGDKITLMWNSSVTEKTDFTILYSSATTGQQSVTPTEIDEWTSPPLTSDMVFTLIVTVKTKGGQPLTAAMSTVVSVQNPALVAKSIKAETATSTGLTKADTLEVTNTTTLNGHVTIGTAAAPSYLTVEGDYWGKGALQLHAPEGNGKDGSALIQARDESGTSKIGLILRTQDRNRWNDVISLTYDGKAGIGTNGPNAKLEIVNEDQNTNDILRVGKGNTNYLAIQHNGNVNIGSAENKLNAALLVTGQIQSSHKHGGLYLDDTGGVFVGNNKMDEQNIDNIGFAVPGMGFNAFQIVKKTANVGIGTMAPQGRLHVKDYLREGIVGGQVTLVIEGSSEMAYPPGLALVNTHNGKPVTDAPVWVMAMDDLDSLSISYRDNLGNPDYQSTMKVTKGGVYFGAPIILQNAYGPNTGWYQLVSWNQTKNWASWQQVSYPSDIRLKEDVRPITGALDKVNRLQGALHRWSDTGLQYLTQDRVNAVSAGPDATEEQHEALRRAERQKVVAKLSGDHIGLIAQDVEAIVPEVVFENEDGHKCIRYPQLVALLVEAIKEQNQTLKDHAQRIAQQQAAIDRLTHV